MPPSLTILFFDSTSADHQRVIEALRALSEGENLEEYINVDEVLRYSGQHRTRESGRYFGTMEHNYYLYRGGRTDRHSAVGL